MFINIIIAILNNCSKHIILDSYACPNSHYDNAKGIYQSNNMEHERKFYRHSESSNYITYVDDTWMVNSIKVSLIAGFGEFDEGTRQLNHQYK